MLHCFQVRKADASGADRISMPAEHPFRVGPSRITDATPRRGGIATMRCAPMALLRYHGASLADAPASMLASPEAWIVASALHRRALCTPLARARPTRRQD